MISPNKLVGSLVYRTREALNRDRGFLAKAATYEFAPGFILNGKMSLQHFPGTHSEIAMALTTVQDKRLKYPAVLNFHPVEKRLKRDGYSMYLNLAFVAPVKSSWYTEHRETETFDKILRPVFNTFMKQVEASRYFDSVSSVRDNLKVVEIFTTGKSAGKTMNIYGDFLDAIEVYNLALDVRDCYRRETEERILYENSMVTEGINEILK